MGKRDEKSFQKDHHIGLQGFYSHIAPKPSNSLKRYTPANGQFATCDDFDDDAVVDVKGPTGLSNGSVSCKVSQFIKANRKKLKVASGDDDLPKRDDFAERRKKYEKWVLAGTGIKTEDNTNDDNDVCKQAKIMRPTKRAAKAETYSTDSRKSAGPLSARGDCGRKAPYHFSDVEEQRTNSKS